MTNDQMNKDKLLEIFRIASTEFVDLLSSFNDEEINKVPYEDSWTAAQLGDHVTKSYGVIQLLTEPGKPAERDPAARIEELKKIFLDFSTRLKSPKSVLPTRDTYKKDEVTEGLRKASGQVIEAAAIADFNDLVSDEALGELTKLEIVHFAIYHTQRHFHQLKKISGAIKHA